MGETPMSKERCKTSKTCSHYRDPKNLNVGGAGYCNLDNQTECDGQIELCQNPEALKEYLMERGFGWEKKKGKKIFRKAFQFIGRLANACWR